MQSCLELKNRTPVWLCLLAGLLPAACAGGSTDVPIDSKDLGRATLELTTVPSGVQCLKVTAATSGSSVAQTFPLSAGTGTSTIDLGRLPLGQVCAMVVGGGAWCWGDNVAGNIGDGTRETRYRATPVSL